MSGYVIWIFPEKNAELQAKGGNPDQMPHSVASDLGLHCLPIILLEVSRLKQAYAQRCFSYKTRHIICDKRSKCPGQHLCSQIMASTAVQKERLDNNFKFLHLRSIFFMMQFYSKGLFFQFTIWESSCFNNFPFTLQHLFAIANFTSGITN